MTHLRIVSGLRNIAIQGCNKRIVNVSFLRPRDSVLFIEVSVFQGVRISGFHCITNLFTIEFGNMSAYMYVWTISGYAAYIFRGQLLQR